PTATDPVGHATSILWGWDVDQWRQNDPVRRVVDARGVLGVQVVVVLRSRGTPRVAIGLPELIVLRATEGVTQAAAPEALARPLVEDKGCRVILPATAGRHFVRVDVAELWERTQKLTTLHGRARAQFAGLGNSEERIGNRFPQLRRIPAATRRGEELPGE